MDSTLDLWISLSLILPTLLIVLAVLIYSDLSLRRQLRTEKQRVRELGHVRKGNRRLYLIDTERK